MSVSTKPVFPSALMLALLCCLSWASLAQGAPVVLSKDKQPAMPIVVGPARSIEAIRQYQSADLHAIDPSTADQATRVERAIGALAQYLGRMGQTTFTIEQSRGSQHLAVGLVSDFPELKLDHLFDAGDLLRQEEYLIRSHDKGLMLIAITEQALENGVWDLLHRLGHRQYFPGKLWEHVPTHESLSIEIDTFEKPDFHSRLIWYGGGTHEHHKTDYHNWAQRNRAVAGLRVNTSHEYGRIISRNREAFSANPDYYAMLNGERKYVRHAKFNASHPGLQKLVVEDAIKWFEANPKELSKSMDPSDFGNWDQSDEAKAVGSPSDQALLLANLVADAATRHFKADRFVGMYAYYQHQQAPTNIKPHPNVIVSFATRFLNSGKSHDTLIKEWVEVGTRTVGVREYYGCHYFDRDLPLRSFQGASLSYIVDSIPHFHKQGARFFTSESNDNWGMLGVGHYMATRLLWDISEASSAQSHYEEFIGQMFGSAREPMKQFYDMLNGEKRYQLMDDNSLGQLYRHLGQARKLAASDSQQVRDRIDHLILYVRYVDLFTQYLYADEAQAQTFYEQSVQLAYRMRHAQLVSINNYINGTFRNAIPKVNIPSNARWNIPEGKNPWKNSDPFTPQEIQALLDDAASRIAPLQLAAQAPELETTGGLLDGGVAVLPAIRHTAADLHVDAVQGQPVKVEVRTRILDASFGPTYGVISPSGQVLQTGRVDISHVHTIQWTAQEAGTYRVMFEATHNPTRYGSDSKMRLRVRDLRNGPGKFNLHVPRDKFHVWIPAGDEPVSIQVAGQGSGERVKAWLVSPDGKTVDEKDNITGVEPHNFTIPASTRKQGQVWTLHFNAPSTGHFEDAMIELPASIPWFIAADPQALIPAKQ